MDLASDFEQKKSVAGPLLIGACSDRLRTSEGPLLRSAVPWTTKTAALPAWRGKVMRLTSCHTQFRRLGCEKRQTYEAADVLLPGPVALGDLDHPSATDEIVGQRCRAIRF